MSEPLFKTDLKKHAVQLLYRAAKVLEAESYEKAEEYAERALSAIQIDGALKGRNQYNVDARITAEDDGSRSVAMSTTVNSLVKTLSWTEYGETVNVEPGGASDELHDLLHRVLERPEEWLATPNKGFGGRRPEELVGTPEEQELIDVLKAAEHGMF